MGYPIEPIEIETRIYFVRGHRVMVDADLAQMYGVPTHRLNEQVQRNLSRFPLDFMFRLTADENQNLISQFAISRSGWGGRRKYPQVFTQEGVAMLSSVLRSERAVQVNIQIMRTFVRIKKVAAGNREVLARLDTLEKKYNRRFRIVFEAIRHLMEPPMDPAQLS